MIKNCTLAILLPLGLLTIIGGGSSITAAQEPADYFRQNCVSCHSIGGGRLTGPDLKDVTQRKDRPWLAQFMLNPKAAIDGGDAYALKLQQEARGVIMPTVIGMTKARAEALLDLIEAESKLETSQFVGLQISDAPFTPLDIAKGRDLFLGVRPLMNKGPACISCHALPGIGGLGGGRLGPDLTKVYERLQGRKGLAAWLFAPATPTMQSLFVKKALQPDEILPIVAYFENAANQAPPDNSVPLLTFFFIGLGGTALALVLFDIIWKKRFRAVRRPLVQNERERKAA
ncbi:MAG TPA: cytochrome c [bacterium]|jgi:mono/diheme cytochrome c family protein